MLNRDEVASQVAEKYALEQDSCKLWYDSEGNEIPTAIVDALIDSELRIQELRDALRTLHGFTQDFSGHRIDKWNKKAEALLSEEKAR
jgi:hypothetical protein